METVLAHFFLARSEGISSPRPSAAASWFRCARCCESQGRRGQCQPVESTGTINLDSLNEVMCWIFCPLFLLDGCGCGSNVDRSGDGRGRGTRSGCADTWLCLHCGGRGTQQWHHFYGFTLDFRLFPSGFVFDIDGH